MARQRIQMGAVILAMMAVLWAGVAAQSSSSCTNAIISMSSCLNYITGNSLTPSSGCCSQFANVVRSQPQCLCQLLSGGGSILGININQTRALALPRACNVQTPPISRCNISTRASCFSICFSISFSIYFPNRDNCFPNCENCFPSRVTIIAKRLIRCKFYQDGYFSAVLPPIRCILCFNLHYLLSSLISLIHQSNTELLLMYLFLFFLFLCESFHIIECCSYCLFFDDLFYGLIWLCMTREFFVFALLNKANL